MFALSALQPIQAGNKQQPNFVSLAQYSKVSPEWKFTFDVTDGVLHADQKNMQIIDGDNGVKALQLTHLKKD